MYSIGTSVSAEGGKGRRQNESIDREKSFCNGRLDLDLEQKANWIIVLDFVW